MTTHTIEIETGRFVENDGEGGHVEVAKHKWRCSCGEAGKRWRYEIRNARSGGDRHVAAMERP